MVPEEQFRHEVDLSLRICAMGILYEKFFSSDCYRMLCSILTLFSSLIKLLDNGALFVEGILIMVSHELVL